MFAMRERTVYSLLEDAAHAYGTNPALYQPTGKRGDEKYKVYNWIDYRQAVEEIAAGLRRLGIGKGDIVALDAETSAEFYLADLGIMTNGSIAAALYTSYPPEKLTKTIRACGAKAIFAGDPKMMKAIQAAAGEEPLDVSWILLAGEVPGAISLDELRQSGAEAIIDEPEFIPNLCAQVKPEDPAILYMTSGATGEPKMGLVTHRSLVANADMGPKVIPLGPKDATIAFLPSAHITQRVAMEFIPLRMGVPVWFSAGLSKLAHELREVKPTFFVAPPRVWERIYSSICTEIRKRGTLSRRLFYGALGLGLEAARRKQRGEKLPPWLARPLKMADKMVFSKIRARFGGRLMLPVSGAAPLGKDLADFYSAIGMPLYEGYGLTEAGIVCLNPIGAPVSGSIGKPLPGVEVRLGEDGELFIKSPTLFSGYFNDPEATAAVLRDGWLATGDIAEIRPDGYIFITGRKKEVLVASNGKKIYPARIETLFKMEPLISQVLLLGDRMSHVAALLTLNAAALETIKGLDGASELPLEELVRTEPVEKEVKQLVARINKQLADFEKIRAYRILERDFTIAAGELTPTMKVRRAQVIENHKDLIGTMYRSR